MHETLILGAGYAGLSAVTQLAGRVRGRDGVRITLVNPADRFTERLRLHQTGCGQPTAELSIPELLTGSGVRFTRGWVTAVDARARTVRVDDRHDLRYDTLVWALGSVADTVVVPGADEHAYTLDGRAEAEAFADRLARGTGPVVVAGGGLTGVEAAAEIAERRPGLDVTLLSRGPVATQMRPQARRSIRGALTRLGVHVVEDATAVRITDGAVILADGRTVEFDSCLVALSFAAPDLARTSGLIVDGVGRLCVDDALRCIAAPEIVGAGDAVVTPASVGAHLRMSCAAALPLGGA